MAISDKQKELLSTLKPPVATTSDRLKKLLGVSDSWISKNKKGLETLSVFVERKKHKPHKPHKPHKKHKPHKPHKKHSNAGKSLPKTLTTLKTLEFKGNTYKLNNFLPLRVISNEVFKYYTLPFPTEVFSNLDAYYTMRQRVLEHFFSEGSPNIPLLEDYVKEILATVGEPRRGDEGDFLKSSQYIPKDVKHSLISLKYLLDSVPVLDPLDVPESALKEIKEAFAEVCPYPPTEEQIQCLYKIKLYALGTLPLSGEDPPTAVSIQADAGVSKTTIALAAQKLLKHLDPYIVAVTNKALDRKGECRTVHALLAETASIDNIRYDYDTKVLLAEAKRGSLEFLIVDEASQVDFNTRYLLETIARKVLYLGDKAQLPPVEGVRGVDRVFLHTLTEQFRFVASEDTFSQEYTKANKELDTETLESLIASKTIGCVFTSSKEVRVGRKIVNFYNYEEALKPFTTLLKSYSSDSHQIIAYTNQCVDAINEIVNEGKDLKVGSKVILQSNDYEKEQYNGFQFRIVDILKEGKSILYSCKSIETGITYKFSASQIDLGYAITTTKSQGSAWPHVLGILNTYPAQRGIDNYVIVTRQERSIKLIETYNTSQPMSDRFKRILPYIPSHLKEDIEALALVSGMTQDELEETFASIT